MRFLVPIAVVVFMYVMSAMNGVDSAELSGSFVKVFQMIPGLSGLSFGILQVIVRKLAHTTEYAALGASTVWSLDRVDREKAERIAFILSVGAATVDEIHQTMVSGRAGQVTDVLVDALGAAIGICILSLFRKNLK